VFDLRTPQQELCYLPRVCVIDKKSRADAQELQSSITGTAPATLAALDRATFGIMDEGE
jgi:hypothetical protein